MLESVPSVGFTEFEANFQGGHIPRMTSRYRISCRPRGGDVAIKWAGSCTLLGTGSADIHAIGDPKSSVNLAEGREAKMVHSDNMDPLEVSLTTLLRMATVACGIQFGWALQFSLLTPYVEELGISHQWAGYIWLCGPITGIVVNPLVGHTSDQSRSRWGRRRPFIVIGACLIACAVLVIGFSADLGFLLGDTTLSRPRAIAIFVVGFWIFDMANNTLQGPARALLADFTGKEQSRARIANAFYSLFMAVGNILGYAAGSYDRWYDIFPFARTAACGVGCANLKSAFLIHVVLLACTTVFTCISADERPLRPSFPEGLPCSAPLIGRRPGSDSSGKAFIWELQSSFRGLPKAMWLVLAVSGLSWFAWYAFLLYDTDWMGREVYKGAPSQADPRSAALYAKGVSMGGMGLTLNAVALGLTSLALESLCRSWGPGIVWGAANMVLSLGFVGMLAISFAAKRVAYPESGLPPAGIVAGALAAFVILGVPMALGWSIPFALTSVLTHNRGGGQGLSMGVLNLSVVIPQAIVSLTSGGWDELFGGGNSPTFCVAAVSAFLSGVLAITVLRKSLKGLALGELRLEVQ